MNGIFIVALIACLIFCIGLGFGILTIHSEVVRYSAQLKRQQMAEAEWRDKIENRIAECEETEAELGRMMVLSDGDFRSAALAIQNIRAEIADISRKTKGTADEQEFLRLKTACLITLPNRIAKLDAIVTGTPYVARIEKQDGMIGMRYVVDDEVKDAFQGRDKPNE